ncbi:hypothetical protein CY0110_22971 [Crocosphaera chwakensis CCY0110]|uniref:Calcineurin-like phosphoesterase domain-containing protein n=2 Tax=Crocosphaera TaxID=263510 RepID=A3IYL3_9CHRO|nr:hypothetical protein CY0110_22971 [Crocosphaera chwakensis CCY0110]
MRRFVILLIGLIVLALALPALTFDDTSLQKTTFVAYGDMPYRVTLSDGRTDEAVLKEDIVPAIQQREDIPFVIHVGDLSRPEYACNDEFLYEVKDLWENEIQKPVFYTPGDNEWTDCDRQYLPNPQSEIERLAVIRQIFFSEPKSLDPQWQYEQNKDLPENELWVYNGVLFVTEHMVSTDNGRDEILLDDPQVVLTLVEQRDQANKQWLDHAFEIAKSKDIKAVVIASQLDPFGPEDGENNAFTRCTNNAAYKEFCKQVQTFAINVKKPMLFVYGDTNAYCYDQPFDVELGANIWRLNTPGDFKYIDASVVSYDPTNSEQPFEVTGLLSGESPPQVCDYN